MANSNRSRKNRSNKNRKSKNSRKSNKIRKIHKGGDRTLDQCLNDIKLLILWRIF